MKLEIKREIIEEFYRMKYRGILVIIEKGEIFTETDSWMNNLPEMDFENEMMLEDYYEEA
jgi:hypothetical protein